MTAARATPVLAQRLTAQGLTRGAATPAKVVERLAALQAQDIVQARWALGSRVTRATQGQVDDAFAAGTVVRAWCLRGTLHAVAPEEVPWLLALLGERNLSRVRARHRELDITSADVDTAARVVEARLRGRSASRDELFTCLEAEGQATKTQRGVHLLFALAQRGLLLQLGEDFALVSDRVPTSKPRAPDEALATLARRYLEGHGPASAEDFAFWAGLPKSMARTALDLAGPVRWPEDDVPKALLLAGFDEYLLGYADRSVCLEPAFFERLVPGGNGVFRPMVVLDGRIEGTWRREVRRDTVTVQVSPFFPVTAAQRRALEDATGRFGEFLGLEGRLEFEAAQPTKATRR
ncbi:MAG: winged helix DNA-binding domain-containing protein [Myxococcaceae bacterium]|nr:winged helix DNA-binding domain-containing protein [Myxococcaceae bacterium]